MNMCGLESSFESRDHYHINFFFLLFSNLFIES